MRPLNLPAYSFSIKEEQGKKFIFDRFRKKHVALTPEEWVRQNFLMYLVEEKNYPASLIAVEAGLKVAQRNKRTDILVYNRQAQALLVVECKAPQVKINEKVFDQIVRYNMSLQVNFLVVTNGLQNFCCKLDYTNNTYSFLKEIPSYQDLI